MTTMLYKHPGSTDINGKSFDYTIVEDEAVEQARAEGWYLTTGEAEQAHAGAQQEVHTKVLEQQSQGQERLDNAAPTRAELEAKAKELGIKFDGRTSDKKLGDQIAAKLAEKA